MIIPAILEPSFEKIEEKINICKQFSGHLHIDFIDSAFSSQNTFLDPQPFSKYSKELFLEAHLMVTDPESFLEPLSNAGFRSFIGQIETIKDMVSFVAKGQELGEIGVGLDLETPTGKLSVAVDDLDLVLLMAVKAGASGQQFDERVLGKIKELKERSFENIEIDGGINDQTIALAKDAGANIFCANSFLFNGNPQEQYVKLSKS